MSSFNAAISFPVLPRFVDSRMRAHDERLARLFLALEDPALAEAARAHAIPKLEVSSHASLTEEAEVILQGWRRLRALDHSDNDVTAHLTRNVLPSLADPRAAILLVMESLDQLDPSGEIRRFTHAWHSAPGEPPNHTGADLPLWKTDLSHAAGFSRVIAAATARHYGMWSERNCCENAGLLYEHPTRLKAIADQLRQDRVLSEVERRTEELRQILGTLTASVVWEWHHAASIDRKLRGVSPSHWPTRIAVCGMVTVVCPDEAACYQALSLLHRTLPHQTLDIQDTIGQPSLSGYQAIHTLVRLEQPNQKDSDSVRVRIVPQSGNSSRFDPLTSRQLERIRKLINERKKSRIQVFAYDGRPYQLPVGSTVLNLALAIHSQVAVHARSALVNRERVHVLYPLSEGDVVRIEVASQPVPPPDNWEQLVPAESVSKLKARFRAALLAPELLDQGRLRLRAAVAAASHMNFERLDDPSFDTFLEDELGPVSQNFPSAGIGNVAACLRRFATDIEDDADREVRAEVISALSKRLTQTKQCSFELLDLPVELVPRIERVRRCERCCPEIGTPLTGVLDDDGTLMIHQAKRKCGTGGIRIEWQSRWSRGQYFLIETTNRPGLAAEVLAAAANSGVDLLDVAATRLGPNWAVIRMHIKPMLARKIAEVRERLQLVSGVLRVIPPNHPIVPQLEANLPGREQRRSLFHDSTVFLAGPVVEDDNRFYGRERELSELRQFYSRIRKHGVLVFVKGPYKTGKSSLVRCFRRELDRPEFTCSVVEQTALCEQSWSDFQTELQDRLLRELRTLNLAHYEKLQKAPLIDIIASFHARLGRYLVLILDEAALLFHATDRNGQTTSLINFLSHVAALKGVMVVLIGPEAPMIDLAEASAYLIRAANQVSLDALTPDEVRGLLGARKLAHIGIHIDVDKDVAEEAQRDTRGNPYWCTLLAESFVKDTGSRTTLQFGLSNYKTAWSRLIENSSAFNDRVRDPYVGSSLEGVCPYFLDLLAPSTRGVSSDELWDTAIERCPRITASQFASLLDRLRARGTIRLEAGHWRIDCKAVAEHWTTFRGRRRRG
ncbi:MAG: AAA family ATPase [Fimbriimonadaceae bacterium]|nr:AAA family ATPase [Fimbriimonadaceae bacterium]